MKFLYILILIFSPLLAGSFLFSPIFKNNEVRIRRFSKGFAALHFIYSLAFLLFFNPLNNQIQYYHDVTFFGSDWIQPLGLKMAFGLDGISILMVALTSFIFFMALIASKSSIRHKHKFYYSMVFLLQTAVLGVFCARDMFLFFMFWELELIPMYFLIAQWGGHEGDKKAKASAMKFVLYTFWGSLFMLLGLLLLHFYNFATYGIMTGDFAEISVSTPEFPIFMQILISILLAIGFAVKLPIVPLHTWLPDAHVDAPTPISMILAAILLKMGAYGLIRFNIGLLPEAFKYLVPTLLCLALINIIYTAFIAYAQTDLKKIVAYSSISNMGIVLLGLCSLNSIGLSGAVFHMISHGVISAGLFMLVGMVYLRTKTRDINELGGLVAVMPKITAFALLLSLAAAGLPLLMGFVGEFLCFLGGMNSQADSIAPIKIYSILAIIIVILSAAYIFRLLHKTFFANMFEHWKKIQDITYHEFLVMVPISLVIVFFGVFPMGIINIVLPVIEDLLQYIHL